MDHHIVRAINRARAFTDDKREGHQKSGIAFKTNKGTKYDNVEWQNTERSDRMQKCQDWEIPAMFPPCESGNCETLKCQHLFHCRKNVW